MQTWLWAGYSGVPVTGWVEDGVRAQVRVLPFFNRAMRGE
jgi:hypothetical protein